MAADNISAKKVVSIRALQLACRFLSQVTFESPQFTNLDNSIDIDDRIGVHVYNYVDLGSCYGRCEIKYYPFIGQKWIPVRFT